MKKSPNKLCKSFINYFSISNLIWKIKICFISKTITLINISLKTRGSPIKILIFYEFTN